MELLEIMVAMWSKQFLLASLSIPSIRISVKDIGSFFQEPFTQVGIRWRTEGEKDEKMRMERGGRGEVRGGKMAVGKYVWG